MVGGRKKAVDTSGGAEEPLRQKDRPTDDMEILSASRHKEIW